MLLWRPLSPDVFHRRRSHSHHTYTVKASSGWKVTKGHHRAGSSGPQRAGLEGVRCPRLTAHTGLPLGRAWPSLTFPEVLQGGQVAGAQVQLRIYL